MKANRANWPITLGCLAVIGATSLVSGADEPAFVHRQSFIGENFFFGFVPNSTQWVSLQASFDCSNWLDIASVATTNTATIIHDPEAHNLPHRFYRLRRPGFSVEDAEAKWGSHVNGDYRCKVRRLAAFHVYTGTLTVTNGQKSIADARIDFQPVVQPDPGLFPSVDEVFASLKDAQRSGCRRVAAIYDPVYSYPTWCVVEQLGQAPSEYSISQFTVLSPQTNR